MVARSVRVNPILDKFRGTPEDWNADVAPGIAAGSPPSLGASVGPSKARPGSSWTRREPFLADWPEVCYH
jgi:hypothetical protein